MTENNLTVKDTPKSHRFVNMVITEFAGTVGNASVNFDEKKKKLAQHLFIQIDTVLPELEKKRSGHNYKKDQPQIIWNNINMPKLAIDAMRRIELGLDALIPNHISIIPYLNSRTKQYDIDLRIGYVGKDYYRRKMAIEPPLDIAYELVHETDFFVAFKKDVESPIETYIFEIKNPFDRGEIIGGFGYISYENPAKNRLVIVGEKDFVESKKAGKSDAFWGPYEKQMRYKTLVHRTTEKLRVDPEKINASFAAVEREHEPEQSDIPLIENIEKEANKTVIDITPEQPAPEPVRDQSQEAEAKQQPKTAPF